MSAKATLRQADVRRQARGLMLAARDTGFPVGSFKIIVEGSQITLLPLTANDASDAAADAERRMRDAFGE